MIRLTPYLSALVALLTVFFYAAPQGNVEDVSPANTSMQTIELPLEVMHYDVFGEHEGNSELPMYGGDSPRYVQSVTFDVSGTPGDLWLWGHHMGFQYQGDYFHWQMGAGAPFDEPITSSYDAPYDGRAKAAIRINGGPWIDVNRDNVTCHEVEEALGCVAGMVNTARFKVHDTASMLQSGENTVEFAFLGHEMLSSGYRVLNMAVLPSGYSGSLSHRDVLPADLITNNKVTDWVDEDAPANADPVQGETLWNARHSLVDWPGGPEIIASCNDCHAQDGEDLQYFAYSNNSIQVRSQHHGLSEQEGKDIAAFIRSFDLTLADGSSYDPPGRPWNPPYQPAPRGFGPNNEHPDVAPQEFWAAGAGLEWIADRELDVYPYLFPDGTANHDAGPFEQPGGISVDFDVFDWNSPVVNAREVPMSIQMPDWNKWLPIIHPIDQYGEATYAVESETAWNLYNDAINNDDWRRNNNIQRAGGEFRQIGSSQQLVDPNTEWNRWDPQNQVWDGRTSIALSQHASVRLWELQRKLGKEGHTGSAAETYQTRGWIGGANALFRIGSHIATQQWESAIGDPIPLKGAAHSHHWYQLAVVVGGANQEGNGGAPIDWNYQDSFLRRHDKETGLPSGTRQLISRLINYDLIHNNGNPYDNVRGYFLSAHTHGLLRFWRVTRPVENTFSDISDELLTKIINQYASAWAAGMYEYDFSQFKRGSQNNDWGFPDERPEVRDPWVWHPKSDQHYNVLRLWSQDYDLSASTADSLARMGDALWDEAKEGDPPWSTWFVENTPAFSLIMTGSDTQTEPGGVVLSVDPAETPDEVRFYQNDVLISTQTTAPFEYDVSGLSAGTYNFRAEAQTDQETINSGIQSLVVKEAWSRSRLEARSRGNVSGALNLLADNIQLEATGTDSGLRPKDAPQQYEAADECRLGERWDFSFDGFSGQYGVWGRAGIQIESDHADGHEVVLLDYLPLQRRMRLSVAKSDESSVRQRTSRINIDTPLTGYVEIEDIQQRAHFQFYLDTTGDGGYDVIRSAHMDTLFDACEISLIATSRSSSQQIEALFTLEKVE